MLEYDRKMKVIRYGGPGWGFSINLVYIVAIAGFLAGILVTALL